MPKHYVTEANKVVVFDLMDSLRVKFNELIIEGEVHFNDAMMGAHNFHKLSLQMSIESMLSDPVDRIFYYELYKETFSEAVDALISKEKEKMK